MSSSLSFFLYPLFPYTPTLFLHLPLFHTLFLPFVILSLPFSLAYFNSVYHSVILSFFFFFFLIFFFFRFFPRFSFLTCYLFILFSFSLAFLIFYYFSLFFLFSLSPFLYITFFIHPCFLSDLLASFVFFGSF